MGVLFVLVVMFVGMVESSLKELDSEAAVPAVYIFGDSVFDVGTNLLLPDSESQANKPFYGIDFPKAQITGRFSNGYNLADSIVQLMGFKQSPYPYLYLLQNDTDYFKTQILKGVNFASGGSGILKDTGRIRFKRVISMEEQIEQFASVRGSISEYLNDTAESTINKSLFLFNVGGNDMFEFFWFGFMNLSETRQRDAINKWMQTYQTHLHNLWKLGARKFGILNIGPLGCVPLLRVIFGNGVRCEENMNKMARGFNAVLEGVMRKLSSQLPGMKYSIGHMYEIAMYIINNPHKFGYKEVVGACCGSGMLNALSCGPYSNLCKNRNEYLLWDHHHPTQNASHIIALTFFNGGTQFVTPFNFARLLLPS